MAAINVSVEGTAFQYRLTVDDLTKVFARYGDLEDVTVSTDGSVATVWFRDPVHAEAATNDLNEKVLNGDEGKLCVTRCYRDDVWGNLSNPYTADPYASYPGYSGGHLTAYGDSPTSYDATGTDYQYGGGYYDMSGGAYYGSGADYGLHDSSSGKRNVVRKYTCKIDIGLENETGFSVARKLIGIKGANMKAIVSRTDAKLRLRGKDSGYLEGDTGKESDEPLHLCISCTNHEGYLNAQQMAMDIIHQTIEDHRSFREVMGQSPLQYARPQITEHPVIISNGNGGFGGKGKGRPRFAAAASSSSSAAHFPGQYAGAAVESGKDLFYPATDLSERSVPCAQEIESLIEKRNEARRVGRYAEADRIRNHLAARGVCLMDDPGARGRGQDVTNWRYQGKGSKMMGDKNHNPRMMADGSFVPSHTEYGDAYYGAGYGATHVGGEHAYERSDKAPKADSEEKDLNTSTLSTQAGSIEATTPQKQDSDNKDTRAIKEEEHGSPIEHSARPPTDHGMESYLNWRGTRSMGRDFDVHSCPDPEAVEALGRPSFLEQSGDVFGGFEPMMPNPRATHVGVFSRRNSIARNSGIYPSPDQLEPPAASRLSRYGDFRNTIAEGLESVFSQFGIGERRMSRVRTQSGDSVERNRSAEPSEQNRSADERPDPRHRFESCLPPEVLEECVEKDF